MAVKKFFNIDIIIILIIMIKNDTNKYFANFANLVCFLK